MPFGIEKSAADPRRRAASRLFFASQERNFGGSASGAPCGSFLPLWSRREVHKQVLPYGVEEFWRSRRLSVKFSEDVVPLTDLKVNPGRVVRHAAEAHRPVLLTSRGRGVAVVQSVADFERDTYERDFMPVVVAGLADLDAGRELSLAEAKSRLGLS